MKPSVIISNKHGTKALHHELPNDFRLGNLGNYESSGKSQNLRELEPSAQSPPQNLNFVNTSKKLLKYRNQNYPVLRYLTRKPELSQALRLWPQQPETPAVIYGATWATPKPNPPKIKKMAAPQKILIAQEMELPCHQKL